MVRKWCIAVDVTSRTTAGNCGNSVHSHKNVHLPFQTAELLVLEFAFPSNIRAKLVWDYEENTRTGQEQYSVIWKHQMEVIQFGSKRHRTTSIRKQAILWFYHYS